LYDAGGNRVKKFTHTQGGNWETITYIDGIIEYREDNNGQTQSISHIMDDSKRIASIRKGHKFGDTTPDIKYNMDDHLGSSNLSVDTNGTLVNREEYYPFGETSFGSYAKKRYRFCGKEKDEESGLYYYGARYYSPWTCRFISVDPKAGKYVFQSPFAYADNNPICKMDYNGEGTGEGGKTSGGNDKSSQTSSNPSETAESKTPKVYQIDKKGKLKEVDLNDPKSEKAFEKAYNNLSKDHKGKDSYVLRRGELVPVGEKAINDLKDLSKANPLIKLGIEKFIKDNQKFQENFPENYYEEFSKYLVNEAAKLNGGNYNSAIDQVSKINDPTKFSDKNSSALYHMYKELVKNQDHDKVRHFVESVWLTVHFGETIATWRGNAKEEDDEAAHLKDSVKHPIGRDENDLLANARGRVFANEIADKQKAYIKQQRRNIGIGSSGLIW